jgi:hypothetical protein
VVANAFADVDVSSWEVGDPEPLGTRRKWWMVDPSERQWLFKPVTTQRHADGTTFPKGEDWSEKIAAELAPLVGLPAATVELATYHGDVGIISLDMRDGHELVHGNEVLFGIDRSYPRSDRQDVAGYTLDAILAAFDITDVAPPRGADPDISAGGWFAGFLILDAWIANTDRHHANWGVLRDPRREAADALAPTFDHASSLGFQLHDDARQELLQVSSVGFGLSHWARRGCCRQMPGRPVLVDLAAEAARRTDTARLWSDRLSAVTPSTILDVVRRVPKPRMSHPARIFCETLLEENLRRLSAALDPT